MSSLSKSFAADLRPDTNSTCLLLLIALLFVHPLAGGYDPAVAVSFITWTIVGLCIVICSAGTGQSTHRRQHAAYAYIVMATVIALRQGPLPISTLGAVVTLVIMAIWTVCVNLFTYSRQHLSALTGGLVVAAAINALIALYQFFGWSITHPLLFIKPVEAGNALGQVNQRNLLAFLCIVALTVLIYAQEWQKKTGLRLIVCSAGILLIAAVAATSSRSGALLIVALSAMIFLSRHTLTKFTKKMALYFAFFYIGFSALIHWITGFNSVLARIVDAEVGCASRLVLWNNTVTIIKAAPWLGHGWGSFLSAFYAASFEQRFCAFPDHAHNLFLQLSAELGVPVAVAAAVYCAWLLVSQRRALTDDTPRKIGYCICVLSLIYSQTEFPLWNVDFLAIFSIGLGLLFSQHTFHQDPKFIAGTGSINKTKTMPLMAIVGGVITLTGAVCHYQYSRVSQSNGQTYSNDWNLRTNSRSDFGAYWLFSNQLTYFRIHNRKVSTHNAEDVFREGLEMIKYAPAPAVILKVIESAKLLGYKEQEAFHTQRLKEIYPAQYDKWKKLGN